MRDAAVRRWSAFHALLYRLTGGVLGRRLVGNDMLLLTTAGHRSARPHTVPLLYLREGSKLVVIASYGGRAYHPTWYDNLVSDPRVTVQIGSRRHPMLARVASPQERSLWWSRIVAAYDGYGEYQSRTDREIPVVLLEPVDQTEDEPG